MGNSTLRAEHRDTGILLRLACGRLSGCQGASAGSTGGVNKVNVQQASDFPIEIHSAALDVRSVKRAWTHINDLSDQPQTIRMHQASNTDAVADFHLFHRSLFQTNSKTGNRKLSAQTPSWAKQISGHLRKLRPKTPLLEPRREFPAFTSFYDCKESTSVQEDMKDADCLRTF